MEPEAQLDARLDTWPSWAGERDMPADRELVAPLAAANRLAPLRQAEPSAAFARTLEQQLLAHAEALRDGHAGRQPRFAPPAAIQSTAQESRARKQPAYTSSRFSHVPKALWPLLAASILLTLGVGTLSAAAHAAPDSPLYGIHRTVENAQAQLASNQGQRVQLHIQYADEALTEVDNAASSGNNSAYATAIATLQSETAAATQALAALLAGTDTQALAKQLSDLRARSAQDLAQDLASDIGTLNWTNRLATTGALSGLGASVPRVSSATITRPDGQGQQNDSESERVDHVVVSGNGFETGAKLIANGQLVSQVTLISLAPDQLVAGVPRGALDGARTIGISNPDGTAAQTRSIAEQQDAGNGDNGSGKGPTATPTDTPDHGKGKQP